MEDQKNHNGEHGSCQGGNCHGWCGGHKHFLARLVLMLLILAGTFWVGVKVGELKSLLESNFDFGGRHGYMMQGYGMQGYRDDWRYPTMMRQQSAPAPQSGIPAKP